MRPGGGPKNGKGAIKISKGYTPARVSYFYVLKSLFTSASSFRWSIIADVFEREYIPLVRAGQLRQLDDCSVKTSGPQCVFERVVYVERPRPSTGRVDFFRLPKD